MKSKYCFLSSGAAHLRYISFSCYFEFLELRKVCFLGLQGHGGKNRSVVSDSLCPILCAVHGILQARIVELGSLSLLQWGLPNPGIKPRSPELQADSLPSELPGKPKNTGVGSLSLLQQIFLTQESNQGLLHCKRILYQLSYQGGPR